MTSLVVVMNNKAAAVAADSAMTITDGFGNMRTRNGVRKLFQLSEAQPVSVMIYGSAEIMEMAWGPIIVNYRRTRGAQVFDTVDEYASDFLDYLDNYKDIFSEAAQSRAYLHYVAVLYDWVRYNANHIVERENIQPSDGGPRNMTEVMQHATDLVLKDILLDPEDEKRDVLPEFSDEFGRTLLQDYQQDIDKLIGDFFGEVELDRTTVNRLRDIAHYAVTRDFFPDFFPNTGLVFTGYGAKQITPEMVAHLVGIAVRGKIRRRKSNHRQVTNDDPVIIAPYAQDKMIRTFFTGIDDELRTYLMQQVIDLAVGVRDRTIAQFPDMNRTQRKKLAENYSDEDILELINTFFERFGQYQYEQHTHPILTAVETLPEMDMASTAEMLIQLNAFQQQVGMTLETVGGEIDVALLTNERFRWVKNSKA